MPNPNNCLRYWDLADHIRIDDAIALWCHLRQPAGQTENRDGSGRESGRFRAFRVMATRSTDGRNPAWRGNFGQKKGPGDYPSPCVWWSRGHSNAPMKHTCLAFELL